jgi:GH43 family beta-xylosidase
MKAMRSRYSLGVFMLCVLAAWVIGGWRHAGFAAAEAPIAATLPPAAIVYQNPLGPQIPDPFILKAADGLYYAYGTTGFRVWSSSDLVRWQPEGVAFPIADRSWGIRDFWAPEVVEYSGRYYMYYSAERASGGKRIGVAISNKPTGPFSDAGMEPLFDPGYPTIDAHVFIDDDGRKYLYYAKDQVQNSGRYESRIYVVELADNMIEVKGEPILCIKPDQPWEMASGPNRLWNEGPTVFKRNDLYYLMYSANYFDSRDYAIGYATSSSPLGPFIKSEQNPIVKAIDGLVSGPGHNSTFSPDGKSLYIAYHSHMNVAAGSGARRMNIDRIGVRADGTLYVNGPTVTPQLLLTGAGEKLNLAQQAVVTASSSQTGYSAAAVIDGEISVHRQQAAYEWMSAGETAGAWLELAWEQPQQVGAIWIWGSSDPLKQIRSGTLLFSDGTTVSGINMPLTPGRAAVVQGPAAPITWLRFRVDSMRSEHQAAALSEIVVLQAPERAVWTASPQDQVTLAAHMPLQIATRGIEPAMVRLALDGENVYSGSELPTYLQLHAAGLSDGEHSLELYVQDVTGWEHTQRSSFYVEHMRLESPALPYGAVVTGRLNLQLSSSLPVEEQQYVSVTATNVTSESVYELYSGDSLVNTLSYDTLLLPDGAYDLTLNLTTAAGVTTSRTYRIVVRNWVIIEDELLPPSTGWFAAERLKTQTKSTGWEYSTGSAALFYGDTDRLRRKANSDEYLIWDTPHLHQVQVTVYVHQSAVEDLEQTVALAARGTDGSWHSMSYTVVSQETTQQDWVRLVLQGGVPVLVDATQLRLGLAGEAVAAHELELGQVVAQCKIAHAN